MARGDGEPTLITSVQRALRLLEVVGEHPVGITAKSLSRRTGIALPTTYHLLRTLVHEGYLAKLDDGAFVVGSGVEGLHAAGREHRTWGRVRDAMTTLRDDLNAAIYLARYHDGEVEVVEVVDCPRSPRVDTWADFRQAAHATAIGKCLLAGLSPSERADHFSRHPPADLTPRTITRVRDLVHGDPPGLVHDVEEYALGTACMAAPVALGDVPATLAISFPTRRLADRSEFARPLGKAAGVISRMLAVPGDFPTGE
ncbi:IclR family transcriptional regulator [Saccharopolyspora taberi]|uniref:IclR family transcriptional regulator C-terminal domain-containing protein n=1 Tax=Saccharopolyspora taberi TaxID=60895 RepID=A0ABN3V6V6_9PSEU